MSIVCKANTTHAVVGLGGNLTSTTDAMAIEKRVGKFNNDLSRQ
jgi:hypothetical protein